MLSKKYSISNIKLSLKIDPIDLDKIEKECFPSKHPNILKSKRYPNYISIDLKKTKQRKVQLRNLEKIKKFPQISRKTTRKHHFCKKQRSSL